MALDGGFIFTLLAQEQYKVGKIGDHLMQAVVQAITRIQPGIRAVANLYQRAVISNANSTAQTVKTGAGVVYRLRVENNSLSNIVVDVLDGTVLRTRLYCPLGTAALAACSEQASSTDTKGVGVEYATSINVKAFLATDGTTTAAAGVTVKIDFE